MSTFESFWVSGFSFVGCLGLSEALKKEIVFCFLLGGSLGGGSLSCSDVLVLGISEECAAAGPRLLALRVCEQGSCMGRAGGSGICLEGSLYSRRKETADSDVHKE